MLATSPDDKLRNGSRAIELATKAAELTEYKAAYILSTLAAAYAETGDFQTAIKWSSKAVEIGDKEHDAVAQEGAGKLQGEEAVARTAAGREPAAESGRGRQDGPDEVSTKREGVRRWEPSVHCTG